MATQISLAENKAESTHCLLIDDKTRPMDDYALINGSVRFFFFSFCLLLLSKFIFIDSVIAQQSSEYRAHTRNKRIK